MTHPIIPCAHSLRNSDRTPKPGDEMLRGLLVECAHHILGRLGRHGPDTDLKRWALKLAERGGKAAKKRAVVAMAQKLSVLLLRLLDDWGDLRALAQREEAQRASPHGSVADDGRARSVSGRTTNPES